MQRFIADKVAGLATGDSPHTWQESGRSCSSCSDRDNLSGIHICISNQALNAYDGCKDLRWQCLQRLAVLFQPFAHCHSNIHSNPRMSFFFEKQEEGRSFPRFGWRSSWQCCWLLRAWAGSSEGSARAEYAFHPLQQAAAISLIGFLAACRMAAEYGISQAPPCTFQPCQEICQPKSYETLLLEAGLWNSWSKYAHLVTEMKSALKILNSYPEWRIVAPLERLWCRLA